MSSAICFGPPLTLPANINGMHFFIDFNLNIVQYKTTQYQSFIFHWNDWIQGCVARSAKAADVTRPKASFTGTNRKNSLLDSRILCDHKHARDFPVVKTKARKTRAQRSGPMSAIC